MDYFPFEPEQQPLVTNRIVVDKIPDEMLVNILSGLAVMFIIEIFIKIGSVIDL